MISKVVSWLRRRWSLEVLLLLVLLAGSRVTVLADGPLSFLDEEPLIYKLEDPAKPIHVAVKNDGQAVAGLQFRVVALQGAEGTPVGEEVVRIRPEPDEVEAFDVGTFTLTLTLRGDLPAGSYNGFLVVSAPETVPAHRPFTLEVQREAEEAPCTSLAGLVPQDTDITILQTRPLPWENLPQGGNTAVILYGTGVKDLDLSAIRPVSTVLETDQGLTATVTLRPERVVSDNELQTSLSLSRVPQPGQYKGDLLLAPTGTENDQKITVTALVRDHWMRPLFTIAFGVVLAYFISKWLEEVGPRTQVELWCNGKLGESKNVSDVPSGGDPDYSIHDSVQQWVADINETLEQGDVDKAKENLEKLDERLERFRILRRRTSSLSNQCNQLKDTLESAEERTIPVAMYLGKQLLKGVSIQDWPYDNTNLDAVSLAVGAANNFLNQFRSLYEFYRKLLERIDELATTPGSHKLGLYQYRRELRAIHDDLWNAESEEKLEGSQGSASILARLNNVRMGLTHLPISRDKPPLALPASLFVVAAWRMGLTHLPVSGAKAPLALPAPLFVVAAQGEPLPELPPRVRLSPLSAREILKSIPELLKIKLVDRLVLVLTLALVTLAGLATLYPGSTFGTCDDYLKALLWGSVGQQITDYVARLADVAKKRLVS